MHMHNGHGNKYISALFKRFSFQSTSQLLAVLTSIASHILNSYSSTLSMYIFNARNAHKRSNEHESRDKTTWPVRDRRMLLA